jgi:hypothetical protein
VITAYLSENRGRRFRNRSIGAETWNRGTVVNADSAALHSFFIRFQETSLVSLVCQALPDLFVAPLGDAHIDQ